MLLFLPLRTLLGLIEGFVVLLLALMIGVSGPGTIVLLAGSMLAFGAVCEFLLPFLIVSKDPERVLEAAPAEFPDASAGRSNPITSGLLHLLNRSRKRSQRSCLGEPRRGERRRRTDDRSGRRAIRPPAADRRSASC